MALDPTPIWLHQPEAQDPGLAGGKAASLARLQGAFSVPPGFILPGPSLAAGGWEPALQAALDRMGSGPVAVRSSAIDEDGVEASFAGQHDTYLGLVGYEAVADAVRRTWASARSQRARAYRVRRGLDPSTFGLAVLVQQLVVADVAAVAFSRDPVGNLPQVVIEACWGLGESIVSGQTVPDVFRVDRESLALLGQEVGSKAVMALVGPGGTRVVPVPRLLQRRPCLDNSQAASLARVVLRLEEVMGHLVDVEAAWQGQRWHLLQCRPITTLSSAGREVRHE
jgi:phosphoenolpyruvate synthase/pyruvate phosphate dikinase